MPNIRNNTVDEVLAEKTILAALRAWQSNLSWKAARELLGARRVAVNGATCLDEAWRLKTGDVVEVSVRSRCRAQTLTSIERLHR